MTEPINDTNVTPDTTPVVPPATPVEAEEVAIPSVEPEVVTSPVIPTIVAEVEPLTTDVVPSESVPTEDVVNARRTVVWQYSIATIIVLVMGAGLWYALEQQGRVESDIFGTLESLVTPEPAAVLVNGQKVSVALYEKNRTQLTTAATGQGLDPATPEVAEQINLQSMELLVNTELLRQAAVASGVEVSEADIEARYQELVASVGGEEALASRLTELGLTPEGLRSDIAGELLIQKHIDAAVDMSGVVIADADIEAFYAQVSSTATTELPPLDEVREEIREQLLFTKKQELISVYIETLRTSATIETKI